MLIIFVREIPDYSAYIELLDALSPYLSKCFFRRMISVSEAQDMMITPAGDKSESEQMVILEEVASALRKTEYPFQLFEEQY